MATTQRPQGGFPPQQQELPGLQADMTPQPQTEAPYYKGSDKLKDKVALITGGDSGIGRAVAVFFAREGADICINYLPEEQKDAEKTRELVRKEGKECLLIPGDLKDVQFCKELVQRCVDHYKKLDVLVNNAAMQIKYPNLESLTPEDLELHFKTNFYSMIYVTQEAIKNMKPGSSIINSTSVTAFQGNPGLIAYASTKGAIRTFTYSLAANLAEKGIRVNAVAPGPIWTPLIPASFDQEKVKKFGTDVLLKRAGQPEEVAPSYVFLASNEMSSYFTGQILHPNGGKFRGV